MNTQPLVSIIVPVYNTAKQLLRCIDSILSQENASFEIILINDGSKDDSGNICDVYSRKDARVRTFHKNNNGVSSARNLGIEKAKGEWIWFVDSDDYIYPDAIRSLTHYANTNLDCIIINHHDQRKGYDDILSVNEKPLFTPDQSLERLCRDKYNFRGVVWDKWFRRDVINSNNITFNTSIHFSEDRLFVFMYFLYMKQDAFYTNQTFYCYTHNTDGAMHGINYSYNPNFISRAIAYEHMITEATNHNRHNILSFLRRNYVKSVLEHIYFMRKFDQSNALLVNELKSNIRKKIKVMDYPYHHIKLLIKALLFTHFDLLISKHLHK
jgi:glycosyltransferase involved in cell wall biosynthesis